MRHPRRRRFEKRILAVIAALFLMFSFKLVFSDAIIHASVTGRIWGNMRELHGRLVRFTLRDNGWPNALHDIVIRPSTHVYPEGEPGMRLSPNVLHPGEEVRAQGGVTTFGSRIVADRIIIIGR